MAEATGGNFARQEILHVEARGIARATLRPLFHNQFARIALVRLEALVAHRGPTLAAIEEVADSDVERIAGRSHLRWRRSGRFCAYEGGSRGQSGERRSR